MKKVPEGPTVLVVDDEEIILKVVTVVLRRAGFRVLAATNGADALDLARASGAPIFLAVLDLVMPQLGGARLLAHLHELDPRIRALFISGYNPPRGVPEGCQFLSKPFTAAELLRSVGDAGQRTIVQRA
jgi:CheY-like chemotaxis protein